MKIPGSTPQACWPTCALHLSTTPYLLPWLSSTITTSTSKLSRPNFSTWSMILCNFSWRRTKCKEWIRRWAIISPLSVKDIRPWKLETIISFMPLSAYIWLTFHKDLVPWHPITSGHRESGLCLYLFSFLDCKNAVGFNLFWNGYLGTESGLVWLESILCLRDNTGYWKRKDKLNKISNVPLNYIAG